MTGTNPRKPYVDYAYYKAEYRGSAVSEDAFENAEIEAEAFVDMVTFGRIGRLEEIPACVKNAVCSATEAMAEYLSSRQSASSEGIKSESNDGYSVTYATHADALKDSDCQDSMLIRVKRHLAGTGLMYRGYSEKYDKQC